MLGLYFIMVIFNAIMLAFTIAAGLPAANIIVWTFATTMWTAAAVVRYRSRAQ